MTEGTTCATAVKKYLAVFLILVLGCLLVACGGEEEEVLMDKERSKLIDQDTERIRENLEEGFAAAEDTQGLIDTLLSFADENEIYYRIVNDNTVIMITQPNEETADLPDATLQCAVSLEDPAASAVRATTILSALRNNDNTRRTTAILTLTSGTDLSAVTELPKDYLATDQMINLVSSKNPTIYNSSASLHAHRFTHKVSTETISDKMTYRITVKRPAALLPTDPDAQEANPLLILYHLLSWCESSHIDYHVTEFKAGALDDTLPEEATLLLSIDASDNTKFQNKLQKEMDAFVTDYGTQEDGYLYTRLPQESATSAVSTEDMTELLGLLYTLQENFEYLSKDEEEDAIGIHTIAHSDVSTDGMTTSVLCRYKAPEPASIVTTFEDLGQLNDFTVTEEEIVPYLFLEEDSPLRTAVTTAADEAGLSTKDADTYRTFESGYFAKKQKDLPVLSLGVDESHVQETVRTLILFLEMTPEEAAE